MALGHKIRELRIRRGLTQSDLADGIVTPSMISLIESERANPSDKVLRALADRLGVSLEEIIAGESSDWEQSSTLLIAHSLLLDQQADSAKDFLLSHSGEADTPTLFHDLLLLDCYIQEGNAAEALHKLEQLEEQFPHDASTMLCIWTKMAGLYAESGNVELASHYWKKAYQICVQEPSSFPRMEDSRNPNIGHWHKSIFGMDIWIKHWNMPTVHWLKLKPKTKGIGIASFG